MDLLPLGVLRDLAEARHYVPGKLTRVQLLDQMIRTGSNGPFGTNPRQPQYQQVLELRLIPRYVLLKELERQGNLVDRNTSTDEAIALLLHQDLDETSEQALDYYKLSISNLQLLTGSSDTNKIRLITQIITGKTSSAVSPEAATLLRYGVQPTPVVGRRLLPLNRDPKGLSATDLLAAVKQGYDVSGLAPLPSATSLGLILAVQQALSGLGLPLNTTAKYPEMVEQLVAYATYPVAPWWDDIKATVAKMFLRQRRLVLDQLGLAQPTEVLSDNDVLFRLSHGGSPPTQSSRAATVLAQRPDSNMAGLLTALDAVPDASLKEVAARYGIMLPFESPRETLHRVIFMYEWLDPKRPLLSQALATATNTTELLSVLRRYDDFDLMAVWPGFGTAPRDRRELLQQLLQQLPRDHFNHFAGCDGITLGRYAPLAVQHCWTGFPITSDFSPWPRDVLVQLSRVVHRAPLNQLVGAANAEDDIVTTLLTETIESTQADFPPRHDSSELVRTELQALFELGVLAMGWDGQSAYPLERQAPNTELIPYAQQNLAAPGTLTWPATLTSYVFDGEGRIHPTGRPLTELVELAHTDPVPNSLEIVQTAYIYLLIWFGHRVTPFNPFVWGR